MWTVVRAVFIVVVLVVLGVTWQFTFFGSPYYVIGSLLILGAMGYAIWALAGMVRWMVRSVRSWGSTE